MASGATFPNMLALARIGSLDLRNRVVMPPMGTNYFAADGGVTRRGIDYYEARAAGGVGLIIVEATCVESQLGRGFINELNVDDDRYIPGLSELAAAIKRHGGRSLLQLHHAGREAHLAGTGLQPVAPSPLRSINPKLPAPHALSVAEIRDLVDRFAAGAERARRAGFDGVEVHGAHTYLLSQFLSPLCNVRDDEYGGSVANRARFVVEVVRAIRGRVGQDYPLCVRLTADEYLPGGITVEETCTVARMLEEAGADAIHVSAAGMNSVRPNGTAPACYPTGNLLHLSARVRSAVSVPVIGVGRINTPAIAEAALRDGKCDLVAIGRGLIADPDFVNKAAAGRHEDIRPCNGCMNCLSTVMLEEVPLACGNNPAAGREREMLIERAVPKKVFVVGGGVAGMEAARVAALRGHDVTLFERGEVLGGQLNAAAMPPHKGELILLREYYLAQVAQAGVKTVLGQAVDAETIADGNPDAVVVATGSRPRLPDIPTGDGATIVFAEDVLLGKVAVGQRVVVIGGELVGCETAEYLAAQGKQVAIARRGRRMAATMNPFVRGSLLDRMSELGVAFFTNVQYERIDERGVTIVEAGGSHRLLEADTVVIAAGSVASGELAAALRSRVATVEVVGDAVQPRRFLEAIRDGMAAGLVV